MSCPGSSSVPLFALLYVGIVCFWRLDGRGRALEARSLQTYEQVQLEQLIAKLITSLSLPLFLYCLSNSVTLEVATSLLPNQQYAPAVPGHVSELPSLNYNLTNPDGSLLPQSFARMRGFQVAFEEVHSKKDLVPNDYLEDRNVNIAGIVFNYNVTKATLLRGKEQLGVISLHQPQFRHLVSTRYLKSWICAFLWEESLTTQLCEYLYFLRARASI